MKKIRKYLKTGLIMFIECGGNPIALLMSLSKKHMLKVVDKVLPDEEMENK